MPGDKNPNPKYVAFSLFISEPLIGNGDIKATSDVSNPTVFDVNTLTKGKNLKNANDFIIDHLREHIKKYGTLNELIIHGHGGDQEMSSRSGLNKTEVKSILYGIENLEKELGVKITNRLGFAGCSTFAELNNNEIKFYREYADNHDMEVVGLTSWTSRFSGRFVQFTPKGEVIRDKLDTRYNPLALLGDDRSWIDYHLGKTQAEAEKAIMQELIKETKELVSLNGIVPVGVSEKMKNDVLRKDEQTKKTDVLPTKNGEGALVITSDGMIRSFGDVKLHKAQGLKIKGEPGVDFTVTHLDDGKRFILAKPDGSYQVYDRDSYEDDENKGKNSGKTKMADFKADLKKLQTQGSEDAKLLAKTYQEYLRDGLTDTEKQNLKKLDDRLKNADFMYAEKIGAMIIETGEHNTDTFYAIQGEQPASPINNSKPKPGKGK